MMAEDHVNNHWLDSQYDNIHEFETGLTNRYDIA